MNTRHLASLLVTLGLIAGCASTPAPVAPVPAYDLVLRGGTVYDGSGGPGVVQDVAINGGTIAAVGQLGNATAKREIDARGQAVAPGFINVLSHSYSALMQDGKSQGEIRQGVTTEIIGEVSMGPLTDKMKADAKAEQGDIQYDITWTTYGEFMEALTRKGISPNIAGMIAVGTVRENAMGLGNRAPTPEELDKMRALVRQAMEEGALGLTTALIYTPDTFTTTEELIALAKVAAEYKGLYTAHMRSEGDRFLEAIDETIRIAREAGLPAEIYHLKAAGQANWGKLDAAIARIEAARASGLRITTNMYTYTAGATGFDAAMPPWVQEGGLQAWIARLKDPAMRARVIAEMRAPPQGWESLYYSAGSAERLRVLQFKNPALKPLTGKTLAEVARLRGTSPEDAIVDLVIEDGTRVGVAYELMTEPNLQKQVALPYMSFGSDAASQAPEGVFLRSSTHPRAYGNFARLFAKYVREDKILSVGEAVRRLTSLPAENFGLARRGRLAPGMHADVVVFDPATIQDHATFDNPHQYATGVRDVLVNGVPVLLGGEHTGALPGVYVRRGEK